MLAFNRRLATAIDECRDVSAVERLLDPDPLRYMWVDEGGGRLGEFLDAVDDALTAAPRLPGRTRVTGETLPSGTTAARPSVAASADGDLLYAWVEWRADIGEQVFALHQSASEPVALSGPAADCYRPTATFDTAGRAWVAYSRSGPDGVQVWVSRMDDSGWSAPELVSTTSHPSFNQEILAHRDGSVELCWQGRVGDRFGIHTRRWTDGAWSPTITVNDADAANV